MQSDGEQAFTLLYIHYSMQLYVNVVAIIKDRTATEEIIQEAFTRIWQNRQNPALAQNFAGYLYRTTLNLVHDYFRKLKHDRELLNRFKAVAEGNYVDIEENITQRQSDLLVRNAIAQLPPQQRRVYELVKIEGCSYRKAAEEMMISPLTVKEYLVAANKSLKKYISRSFFSLLPLLISYPLPFSGLAEQ